MNSTDMFWPTMTIFIGIVGWLIGTRVRRGSALSPYSLMLLILVSIFGVRPLLMPAEPESYDFYGYSISSGFQAAAFLGFLGTLMFVLGSMFWSYVLRQLHERKTSVPKPIVELPTWMPRRATAIAWGLSGSWLLLMIVLGGGVGFISLLFAGRSADVISRLENVPAFVSALPVIGCLTVATVRFQYERTLKYTRGQSLAYWLVAVTAVVPPLALGTRRYLIPSILIAVIGALANNWHGKIKLTWIATGAAGFLALAIIPFVRSAGSRTALGGDSDLIGAMGLYFKEEGLRGTLNNFFLSYDTEMFNYVAYLSKTMGSSVPFGMGRGTIGELVAMPLPAAITPFQRWNDVLLTYAFGANCSYETACPVPSIVGVLYSDLALPGLILGMFAIGIMAARFETSMLISSGAKTSMLLLIAGFSVAFARGNSMAQVWIAVQCFIVWWVVQKLLLNAPKPKPGIKGSQLSPAYKHLHAEKQAAG